jgi:hypothetical protein
VALVLAAGILANSSFEDSDTDAADLAYRVSRRFTKLSRNTTPNSNLGVFIVFANVPSDLSLLAFGIPPAREAESAGGMPKVPEGQGLGRLVCWAFFFSFLFDVTLKWKWIKAVKAWL